uniref:C2H2-type domain-containing protein n=1 Tax=Cacopsylla melanoneura TaxID=428564 RepID=A0A8D8URN2_9HEMI
MVPLGSADSATRRKIRKLNTIVKTAMYQFPVSTVKEKVLNLCRVVMDDFKSMKCQLKLLLFFKQLTKEEYKTSTFKTKNTIITESSDLEEIWNELSTKVLREMLDFELKDSGWSMHAIGGVELRLFKYEPIRCGGYLPTPKFLSQRSLINIQNTDDKCFKYAMSSKFLPQVLNRNAKQRLRNVNKLTSRYNWDGLTWPINIDDLIIFENNNEGSAVNVCPIDENKTVKPFRLSKVADPKDSTDLLILMKHEQSHFVYIKDFSVLVSNQLPHSFRKSRKKLYICKKCIIPYLTEKQLLDHSCNGYSSTPIITGAYNKVPKFLRLSKFLTVTENSLKSFEHCILKNKTTTETSGLEKNFTFKGISDNTTLKEINVFEKNNANVSINVFGFENKKNVVILKACQKEKDHHFDLVLSMIDTGVHHYSYITNFSKFISRFINKHKDTIFVCKMCFSSFNFENNLLKHRELCKLEKPVIAVLPEPGKNIMKFKNIQNQERIPFAIYADFECLLKKVDACEPCPEKSFTLTTHKHIPFSFAYYVVGPEDVENSFVVYTAKDESEDVVEVFFEKLVEEVKQIEAYYEKQVPLNLSPADEIKFQQATECEQCHKSFGGKIIKVRDHYHYGDGSLRSVLCQQCNLLLRNTKFVPVFFHNFSGYDSHLITRGLDYDGKGIKLVPSSTEKYISFSKIVSSKISIRFLDSFRFMSASLDQLSSILPKEKFHHMKKHFNSPSDFDLVKRKGIFCYEYMDNYSKLKEIKLPCLEEFYSSLNDSNISPEDYMQANVVWDHFKCKKIEDYAELYLKTDVLLLADVFESFRSFCLDVYKLDPAWYYSIPGVSLDSMLKNTGVELELLTDYDMYLFFENAIRGGITQCNQKYAEANNKYMESEYDDKSPSSFLMYLDANNLYGYSMIQKHPQHSFQWMSEEEINSIDISKLTPEDDIGFYLEVDIEYPSSLHNLHSDLPFFCEKKKSPVSGAQKLLTTVENKEKYIVHYLTLKQALEHGLKLKKIHRGIKFFQSNYLTSYINLNTELRKNAKDDFSKDLYKLFNNSMYGKLIESVRKRVNVKLQTSWNNIRKDIAKPTFEDLKIFKENLVLVQMQRTKIKFDKPIFAGASILDQSKNLMYKFHYESMIPKFGSEAVNLLYMDTDSFFYQIKTEDLYKDLEKDDFHMKELDTSDYPQNHFLHSNNNKKVLGMFKDELCGEVMKEFVGLASKLYSFTTVKGKVVKKAKGVKKNVTKRQISFEDYKRCLLENKQLYRKMVNFKSTNHNIETTCTNKLVLNNFDDKRFLLQNGINTLPFGHIDIPVERME